jgi:hypothetical protein
MKTTPKSIVRALGAAVVFSGLALLVNNSKVSGAAILSDELVVLTPPGGPPAADILIPETPSTGPGTEPSALYAPTTTLTGTVAPGTLLGLIPPGGVAGETFVILSEPRGEPIDPTELPPVTFSGPNGPVVVSDLLISGIAGGNTPFIALVSDNNPDLATIVGGIPPTAPIPILPETGLPQDVSVFTAAVFPGATVLVRSDVSVPEPSSIVIMLGFAGIGLIGIVRRHVRLPAC